MAGLYRYGLLAGAFLLLLCNDRRESVAVDTQVATLDEMDALWVRRKETGILDRLVAVGQAALRTEDDVHAVSWRLARALCWKSQVTKGPAAIKDAAAACMRYAEVAIESNPDRVEGHFLYGFAVGIYGSAVGIPEALLRGISSSFEKAMQRAYELDKHYEDGAPIVALGRFYHLLPWPLRDLERSAAYLEEARRTHPTALFGRVYLAETYYALGREQEARQELELVVAADPNGAEWEEPAQIARADLGRWFGAAALASAARNRENPIP